MYSPAPLTSILKTSSSTDSSTSAAQIMVEFDEVDADGGASGKLIKKLSKVKESSWSPKASKVWKNCKGLKKLQRPLVWKNVYQSTNPPSIRYRELELFLLGPEALSIPFSNRLPTSQSEWSCWCSVAFFPREARKIFKPRTLEFFASYNQRSLCTKVCLQNARLPFAQILEMRSGRRRPSPGTTWLLGGYWGSYSSLRPVLCSWDLKQVTSHFAMESTRTWCQKILAVAATNSYPLLKQFGQDCQCLPIRGRQSRRRRLILPGSPDSICRKNLQCWLVT